MLEGRSLVSHHAPLTRGVDACLRHLHLYNVHVDTITQCLSMCRRELLCTAAIPSTKRRPWLVLVHRGDVLVAAGAGCEGLGLVSDGAAVAHGWRVKCTWEGGLEEGGV